MAKVFLTGIEESVMKTLQCALTMERHQIEHRACDAPVDDFLGADIVFAGGGAKQYLPLLRRVRQSRPSLPFIVVAGFSETSEWLDALEAGATDYCSAPFQLRQINWLMESAIPRLRGSTA
jgi:DNA-binding NtrC family response regulator